MTRLINRTATFALSATLALGAAAVPCAAGEPAASKSDARLTRLSPTSRQVLASSPKAAAARLGEAGQPTAQAVPSGSFLKSTRGKITLALMGAGVGFTVWSINHDRKPVKSPIR